MEKAISPIPIEVHKQEAMASTHHKTSEGIKNAIFGSVAGMTGKVFEYPFDTVKTRLQTQLPERIIFMGPLDCFKKTFKKEGIWGFYRVDRLKGAMLENAMLFLVYNQIQMMIIEHATPSSERHLLYKKDIVVNQAPLSMYQLCLAGGISGSLTSFTLTPLELIKCKLQVQETFTYGKIPMAATRNEPSVVATRPAYTGPMSIIKYTIKEHGIGGLYRGHFGTLIRETFGGAAWFGTYEFVSRLFMKQRERSMSIDGLSPSRKTDLSAIQLMISGACAGMAYNITIFPVDSIKSQVQTDEEMMLYMGKKVVKRGFFRVGKEIYKNNGIPGFYRGCGITVARAAPSSAIIFMTYETVAWQEFLSFSAIQVSKPSHESSTGLPFP
ncbi:14309_t:CDS:2 [Acaulospora colombiana]|uniref:14309_t:CDS:1 n=1 Tax=Acaulospora colombiana TaxID=27376 RepID=A0ACA9KMI7_9GLOM|nr:14309_t:CDS:2 [Acaulospora colombiana]